MHVVDLERDTPSRQRAAAIAGPPRRGSPSPGRSRRRSRRGVPRRATASRSRSGWVGPQASTMGSSATGVNVTPGAPASGARRRTRGPGRRCGHVRSESVDPPCRSSISTPGCAAWKRARIAGRFTAPRHCRVPTASVPRSRPCTAATASLAAATPARVWRASVSSACPSSVSSTLRVLRTNRPAPSSRSSDRIDADRPDCATCIRAGGPGEVPLLGDGHEVLELA